jgi:hypothetical protein
MGFVRFVPCAREGIQLGTCAPMTRCRRFVRNAIGFAPCFERSEKSICHVFNRLSTFVPFVPCAHDLEISVSLSLLFSSLLSALTRARDKGDKPTPLTVGSSSKVDCGGRCRSLSGPRRPPRRGRPTHLQHFRKSSCINRRLGQGWRDHARREASMNESSRDGN